MREEGADQQNALGGTEQGDGGRVEAIQRSARTSDAMMNGHFLPRKS